MLTSDLVLVYIIIPLVSLYLWYEFVFIFGAALILMH